MSSKLPWRQLIKLWSISAGPLCYQAIKFGIAFEAVCIEMNPESHISTFHAIGLKITMALIKEDLVKDYQETGLTGWPHMVLETGFPAPNPGPISS